MALETQRYPLLPNGYLNALEYLASLVDLVPNEVDRQFGTFIVTVLAETLEQEERQKRFGGNLPEFQQYTTPDQYPPTLPHSDYVPD